MLQHVFHSLGFVWIMHLKNNKTNAQRVLAMCNNSAKMNLTHIPHLKLRKVPQGPLPLRFSSVNPDACL